MSERSEKRTDQWDANRIAVEAEQRLLPQSQSRMSRLVCRLFDHKWSLHPFVDGDDEYRAVTCVICDELRVSGEPTEDDSE